MSEGAVGRVGAICEGSGKPREWGSWERGVFGEGGIQAGYRGITKWVRQEEYL